MDNICFKIFKRFSAHRWAKSRYVFLLVLWLSSSFYSTSATFSAKYNFAKNKNNTTFKQTSFSVLGLVFCFLCFSIIGSGISSAANAYVAASGSADYICDGTNDHVEINKALAYVKSTGGGTVYLKGPNTYWIDSTLYIGSNTKLTGDSTAEIKLVPKAGWSSNVPMIRGDTGAKNIMITGFIIDGNSETQGVPFGRSYYNLINFVDSSNIEVSNMRFEWSCNDGVQVRGGSNIVFTHNDVYKIGHDAFHILYSNNGEVAYNTVFTRTNSACRLFGGASDFTVHDNIIYSDGGGTSTGPAIEIDKTNSLGNLSFNNIEIYNNKISTMRGSGILMVAAYTDNVIRAKNVYIHNNTFTKVGQDPLNTGYTNAAITMQNFDNTIIENNVFDDGGNAAIKWHVWSGYPNHDAFVSVAQQKAQFTTYVRNNVIMNNDGMSGVTGSGVGIWNTQPSYAKFIVQSNNFYNNKNGDTYGGGFTMSNNVNTAPSTSDSTTTTPSPAGSTSYSPTYDNGLRTSSPTSAFPTINYIDIGRNSASCRDLMMFDLSNYKTTDVISKATLSLYWYYPAGKTRTSDTVVQIYRPAADWDPRYVSWTNRASSTKWTTAGGNWFDKNNVAQGATPYASLTFAGSKVPDNKYYDFDVTQLVQEYVSGKYKNTGFFLKAKTESGNYIAFYSSEWTNAAQRPKLTVISGTSTGDQMPVANAGADKTGTVGSAVTFDGSASIDDKGIVSYSWDFDASNGITSEASTVSATKTYTTARTYTVTLTVTDTIGQKSTDTLQVVVSAVPPPTSTVSYPPTYDNRLRDATPTTLLSTSTYVDIGRSTSSFRDVMLFDLSSYKTTDTISKATLSLYWYYPAGATRTSDTIVEVYRPLEWNPQYVTWNSRMSGVLWSNAGGSWFDKNNVAQGATPYASLTFAGSKVPDNKYYDFDVTQLVQEYVSGKYKNTGFFLKAKTESGNYIAFYSSEWTNAAQRPKLTVTKGASTGDPMPVANAGADKTGTVGSAVTFDGSASIDDKGIVSYSWDFDASNGITSEASTVSATKTYTTARTYTVTLTVTDTIGQKSTDTLQVTVSGTPPPTSTVSYAPTSDNRLRSDTPSSVLSTTTYLDIGKSTPVCRDVMIFDLSSYKTTDMISKATLSLYWYYPAGKTRTSDTIVEVYRPLEWNPQYVTWNSRMSGVLWSNAGGSWYDKNNVAQGATPYASLTFAGSKVPDNKYYDFDVTQLVQEYVSVKYKNTGFFLKAKVESGNYIAFYSSEWTNAAQRPKLTVTKA
ncbi:disaggregatase related repeat-containing protein [Methanomethylovorans hollandica]|nr:disaggregatase related repeat-containing protein [Methanomethylovorans hollandica]